MVSRKSQIRSFKSYLVSVMWCVYRIGHILISTPLLLIDLQHTVDESFCCWHSVLASAHFLFIFSGQHALVCACMCVCRHVVCAVNYGENFYRLSFTLSLLRCSVNPQGDTVHNVTFITVYNIILLNAMPFYLHIYLCMLWKLEHDTLSSTITAKTYLETNPLKNEIINVGSSR